MLRSGMFWQFFLVSGGLLALSVLIAGSITWSLFSNGADDPTQRAPVHGQVWFAMGIVIAIGLLVSFWLTWRMIQPLHELAQGARQIAAGEYGRKVFAEGAHEVGVLARSFNFTSERLASQFAQMAEDRQQLRAVLSSMSEGVVAVDAEGKVLFANDRAGFLLDIDSPTAVGRKLWEIVRHRALHDTVGKVLETATRRSQELSRRGMTNATLMIHAGPLPGQPPRGAVLVMHDVTELRRLESLRDEFVANVSHELKTPLSVIKVNVETLIDGAVDDREHRGQFLSRIADQAELLHRLILDLLSLARIESSSGFLSFQAVDLGLIVETCVQQRRTLAEEKAQSVQLSPPKEQVTVWADEEAVLQILDNLVDNAIRYTPEKGNIQIRWRGDGDWGIIDVTDNGLGIADKELPRIFERFYRVDKARSRSLGGTGLGLSIVKHLTQAMQGSVQALSQVNQGSTFTVSLPRPHE